MTDPSEGRPSPEKNPGGSYSADEEKTRDHPLIPSGSAPPLPLPLLLLAPAPHLPMEQPPTSPSGNLDGRPTKKKAKMGKEAAAGTMVAVVEEQGKKKKSASLENLPGWARTCGICQREFATARALFGHMRCHPDRRWRGAQPPPVLPRQEAEVEPERLDVERSRQAEDLASSLLSIGQTILRTEKFKATEGNQTGGSGGGGSSSTAVLMTGQGVGVEMGWTKRKDRAAEETGVEPYWLSNSSSGDIPKERKKKKTLKTLMDEDRRKQIHYQLALNNEALADNVDDDDDTDETSNATPN